MALTVAERTQVWRGVMRWLSANRDPCAALKTEIYNPAANTGLVADLDDWIETHQGLTSPDTVGINGGINASYRNTFTAQQKTLVFCGIAAMRQGAAFARSIFGEID